MKTFVFIAKISPANKKQWPKGIAKRCIKALKKISTIIPGTIPFISLSDIKVIVKNNTETKKIEIKEKI